MDIFMDIFWQVCGEYTTVKLVVGNYRGAPPKDVPFLIERLCDWLNSFLVTAGDTSKDISERFSYAFFAATLGHLYLAWIHPFGDGNGRTARVLECAVLANSGIVPWVSCALLSDHYNRTRTEYYRRLDEASKLENGVSRFLDYAAQGFVDQLREQTAEIQEMQKQIAWKNYVHEMFQKQTQGEASRRRRLLVLSLPVDKATPVSGLRHLSSELAEMYASKSPKTVSHDVNKLKSLGLVRLTPDGYLPRIEVMSAFTPLTHQVA
ncbi:MAG: Fic family protein [Propionibacteriaceae bacterium]|jgi:Fic family protein|nr:Fic family protein [Propionibacteriaceae bacterium]